MSENTPEVTFSLELFQNGELADRLMFARYSEAINHLANLAYLTPALDDTEWDAYISRKNVDGSYTDTLYMHSFDLDTCDTAHVEDWSTFEKSPRDDWHDTFGCGSSALYDDWHEPYGWDDIPC